MSTHLKVSDQFLITNLYGPAHEILVLIMLIYTAGHEV